MQFSASWTISGVVVERRELTSQKNQSWKGWRCKVASLGATFELEVDEKFFRKIADGQQVVCTGRFEQRGNFQNLVATDIRDASAKAVA